MPAFPRDDLPFPGSLPNFDDMPEHIAGLREALALLEARHNERDKAMIAPKRDDLLVALNRIIDDINDGFIDDLLEDEIAALRAAIATLKTQRWRPIETAPKDGTKVWIYAAAFETLPAFQCECGYHPDGGWTVDELRQATHWRPLPPAPGD